MITPATIAGLLRRRSAGSSRSSGLASAGGDSLADADGARASSGRSALLGSAPELLSPPTGAGVTAPSASGAGAAGLAASGAGVAGGAVHLPASHTRSPLHSVSIVHWARAAPL